MFSRTIILASVAAASLVLGSTASAQTADPNWTGPYIGLHVGGTLDDSSPVHTSGVLTGNTNAIATGVRPGTQYLNRNGAEGGAQLGYNYQYGRFVGGVEADIAWADANASQTYQGPAGAGGAPRSNVAAKLDDLGTLRLRLGYLVTPRVLLYGTGGYAYGQVNDHADFTNGAGALAYSGGERYTAGGYAAGVGMEYAYPVSLNLLGHSSAVTFRAEYLHYDLGRKDINVAAVGGVGVGGYTSSFSTRGDELRTGVNFKF